MPYLLPRWGSGHYQASHNWNHSERKTNSSQKGIVYDPNNNSVTILADKDLRNDPQYLKCYLPEKRSVSIFLNSDGSEVFAVPSIRRKQAIPEGEVRIFIGLLDLGELGAKDRLSRLRGKLGTLYVVKQDEEGL